MIVLTMRALDLHAVASRVAPRGGNEADHGITDFSIALLLLPLSQYTLCAK